MEFIESHLRHTKGRYAGKPFQVRPWQREIVSELFSTNDLGVRRYTQALIGMPRKNGKSELCAALALKLLVADGEYGAEVYGAAGDKEQARIVFGVARRMVEFSPTLSAHLKLYKDAIAYAETDSVYRVVSADAPLKHGLNPSGVIFDEVHVQPNDELWEALTTGSGARDQPLIVGITTAGYDEASLCYRLYEYGRKCLKDPTLDPRFYFFWVGLEAESELDYRTETAWRIANPAFGDFLRADYLEDGARRLPEHSFRRLHLNQWTAAESRWLPLEAWLACKGTPDIAPGDRAFVGVDAALRGDRFAVALDVLKNDRHQARVRVFSAPEGGLVSFVKVEDYIRELCSTYKVAEIGYDPNLFQHSASVLYEEGLPMVDWPQSPQRMAPASQLLYDVVMDDRLVQDGDATLRKHVDAVVAKETPRGFQMDKAKSTKPIHGAIALAIAVAAAEADAGDPSAEWLAFWKEKAAAREKEQEHRA